MCLPLCGGSHCRLTGNCGQAHQQFDKGSQTYRHTLSLCSVYPWQDSNCFTQWQWGGRRAFLLHLSLTESESIPGTSIVIVDVKKEII